MPGEVRVQVDVDAAGQYRFRVRSGARELTSAVDADLATSFYEDLRLLRWKSVGVRNPGDVLLNHVGDQLAELIASPERWQELGLRNEVRQVRVQFSQAAHRLMPFPWELLRVNNEFLIGARGSHLVREAPAPAGRNPKRNPLINIVHVSLGTDSAHRVRVFNGSRGQPTLKHLSVEALDVELDDCAARSRPEDWADV